jgi:hypothetical protein
LQRYENGPENRSAKQGKTMKTRRAAALPAAATPVVASVGAFARADHSAAVESKGLLNLGARLGSNGSAGAHSVRSGHADLCRVFLRTTVNSHSKCEGIPGLSKTRVFPLLPAQREFIFEGPTWLTSQDWPTSHDMAPGPHSKEASVTRNVAAVPLLRAASCQTAL